MVQRVERIVIEGRLGWLDLTERLGQVAKAVCRDRLVGARELIEDVERLAPAPERDKGLHPAQRGGDPAQRGGAAVGGKAVCLAKGSRGLDPFARREQAQAVAQRLIGGCWRQLAQEFADARLGLIARELGDHLTFAEGLDGRDPADAVLGRQSARSTDRR